MVRTPALRRTAAYYLLFACLGLDAGLLGPTLPALAGQTRASLGQMGLLFLLAATGGVLGTAASGRLFDRLRGHVVLGTAQLCAAALMASMPLVPQFWMLAAVAGCKGVAQSIVNAGTNTLLIWTHRDKPGPYMNALHFVFGLGAFLTPLLVAQLAGSAGGYRLAYWVLAGLVATNGLRMVSLPDSPRPTLAAGRRGAGAGPAPCAFVLSAALFFFFYGGAEITFRGWAYTYAITVGLADAAGAAYLNSAFWVALTVGRLASIPAAMRFKPQHVIPVAVASCLAFLGLALLFPRSSAALWTASVGLGFFIGPVWATGFTLAGQSVDLSGRLSSLILLGNSLGGMLLPAALGRIIETAGPRSMIAMIFGSLILNMLAFAAMLKLRPRR